jgi:hypothetical protein
MLGCPPPVDAGLAGLSFKKIANAALAVTAVVYPPAAPVIAAGAAIKSATKKAKHPVIEAPVEVAPTSPFDVFGPQYHDVTMVGSAILGGLLIARLMRK